jgi:hypothetical protein
MPSGMDEDLRDLGVTAVVCAARTLQEVSQSRAYLLSERIDILSRTAVRHRLARLSRAMPDGELRHAYACTVKSGRTLFNSANVCRACCRNFDHGPSPGSVARPVGNGALNSTRLMC